MARMDENKGSLSDREIELLTAEGSMKMPRGVNPTTPLDEDMINKAPLPRSGDRVNPVMPLEGGMLDSPSLPIMSEEDKELFRTLSDMGIPEIDIIDIMANAKLGEAVGGAATAGINPAEFGGLPKTGSSPASGNPSMPIVGGAGGMTNQDMSMYLQNKVKEIRGRTGGDMGALSGVPAGNQTPMVMPKPRPSLGGAVAPQRLGSDRTFNPMDQLTPTNAPNT